MEAKTEVVSADALVESLPVGGVSIRDSPPTTTTPPASTAEITSVATSVRQSQSQAHAQAQSPSSVLFEASTQTPTDEQCDSPLFTQKGYVLKTNNHSTTALVNIHKMRQNEQVWFEWGRGWVEVRFRYLYIYIFIYDCF